MPRNAGGTSKAGQIYQPPINKHRKEVGENLRKRSHKPMTKQLKSQENVKKVRENVNSLGYYIFLALIMFMVVLFFVFKYFEF